MNIKIEPGNGQINSVQTQLFESTQPNISDSRIEIKQQQQINTVFSVKSKQFKFDCNIVMGSLNSKVDELKFGLSYHDKNTANFDEFLNSVENFLFGAGMSVTQGDKDRLKAHYKRFSIHKNTVE